jgi:hypothetical protein
VNGLSGRNGWRGASRAVAAAVFCAALSSRSAPPAALASDATESRRVEIGLKLFRAMLAADLDLAQKAGGDSSVLVVLVYTEDRDRAERLAKAFGGPDGAAAEPIHGLKLAVEAASSAELPKTKKRVGGVFLAEPAPAVALKALVDYGVQNHVIVYSPFEGDVENGASGGLAVEAQVRPFVNLATLTASHINLKDFFLKVAKVLR